MQGVNKESILCIQTDIKYYTNGQKKGYRVYMTNDSKVNLKHSIVLT